MERLWDKGEPTDALILRFTVGDDHRLDARLVPYDTLASKAHVRMLARCGHLAAEDAARICAGLDALAEAHSRGEWSISREEEDCHTALERRLTERLPDLGGRVHLGRSRNDQVLAALRLYLLDAIAGLCELGRAAVKSLDGVESRQGEVPLPGYTHMQRAMPSTVALWAGGFRAEIEDDLQGLESARRRLLKNPLGSAAGYGVPVLAVDREFTTRELAFESVHEPVTAVQISRGKGEASLLFELTLLMQDAGRLASELCLFATAEFGFIRLPPAFTTGSSIMPQKRNPDVLELIRGKAAQFPADLQAVLSLMGKLPSGYHRDLQLVKEPLFRAIDRARDVLSVLARVLDGVEFVPERTTAAMDPGLYATERALEIVQREGVPFRDAYRRAARGEGEAGT